MSTSREAVHLAGSLLVPLEEAARRLNDLTEFRRLFGTAQTRGDTHYAKAAAEVLKAA